jgi:hypothetical protein
MAKSDAEIADKTRAIFELAKRSATPITVVSTQALKLYDLEQWELLDIEQVSGDVINLLLINGWRSRP